MHVNIAGYDRISTSLEAASNPANPTDRDGMAQSQMVGPPERSFLARMEYLAYRLPPVCGNVKAMAWMAAIPLAVGGLNCFDEKYVASIPYFLTGASVLGTFFFRTLFYPPNLIDQFLNCQE